MTERAERVVHLRLRELGEGFFLGLERFGIFETADHVIKPNRVAFFADASELRLIHRHASEQTL